jgi:hypothetical protein
MDFYNVPNHSKIKGSHGRILMVVYDWRAGSMKEHLEKAANFKPPSSRADAERKSESLPLLKG